MDQHSVCEQPYRLTLLKYHKIREDLMSLGYDDVIYQYHKQSEGVTVATVQEDS